MSADGNDTKGILSFTELNFYNARSECGSWGFALLKPTSIGDIVQLICAKDRHLFRMSGYGSGC